MSGDAVEAPGCHLVTIGIPSFLCWPMACCGLILVLTERQRADRLLTLFFVLMTHTFVQTFYGAENGWRNVGGRRTAKDAARFCALLGRIRNDRLNKVAEVPVTFVLGE